MKYIIKLAILMVPFSAFAAAPDEGEKPKVILSDLKSDLKSGFVQSRLRELRVKTPRDATASSVHAGLPSRHHKKLGASSRSFTGTEKATEEGKKDQEKEKPQMPIKGYVPTDPRAPGVYKRPVPIRTSQSDSTGQPS